MENEKVAEPTWPAFCSIPKWCEISDSSQRKTYEDIATGDVVAVKDGSRTKIDVYRSLAKKRALPPAKIKRQPRSTKSAQAEA